jgi:cell wall-associated NlpC family hydrolase
MRRYGFLIAGALALAALAATTARAHSTPQIRQARAHARAVRAQVEQIGIHLEGTIQHYDHAEEQLRQTTASLKTNTYKLRVARANYHRAQLRIMARVYQLYVSGKPSTLEVIAGARNLSQVINSAEAVRTMSQQDAALGLTALHFKQLVQKRQHNLKALRATRAKAVLALAAEKRTIEAALSEQKRLLASIHTNIQQLQQQEAAREAAARAAWLARLRQQQEAAREAAAAVPTTPTLPVPSILGNGSGHPEAARIALQYLGVPYVWGGASPSGFDCSGLVMYSYAQIGRSLPHYTVSQWNATYPISQAQAQPGDLVFFNGLEHVGIYLGNGQMVDAPHTGAVVRTESIYYFGTIDGFRRVP